jgi:hypothetical protein
MNVIDERYTRGKSKIYRICCNETGEVFYGYTIIQIDKKMNNLRSKSSKCISKQIINRDNYYYQVVEYYWCNNKNELESRARWYMENNECINKKIPQKARTREETNQFLRVKVICDICGSSISRGHLKNHQRGGRCIKIDG